ncbi:hypothetical protein DICPUDRAFT_151187 [Dictyostelium purpureum]|uniref:Thiol-disulfide oxidoreductase DCC n=1 Tax=Dictyostelium purpureum TaxID=5786 RepID=F0ZI78_DICPU|nr:uncharacterized protein DICPUDRAFT_151187 [Dictyostelium purpureum]EGC36357.1 hypothetical protein DICPUDRAFT_151187 [Dictyostelium purpureum]|eukprot:XP_003287111.1 hypothetical protein DICPUDRAFT_151187 [Dictyostelium purpureum]
MTEISLDINNIKQSSIEQPDGASVIPKRNTYKPDLQNPKKIILFDGICNICDGFVQFVFPRDSEKVFSYQALQTEKGKEIIEYYGLPNDLSTVILVDEATGNFLTKSTAILTVCYYLKAPYPYLYSFSYIPKFIRDFCYGTFANYRYLIMGKKDSCMFSPALRDRFVDFKSPMILNEEESKEI